MRRVPLAGGIRLHQVDVGDATEAVVDDAEVLAAVAAGRLRLRVVHLAPLLAVDNASCWSVTFIPMSFSWLCRIWASCGISCSFGKYSVAARPALPASLSNCLAFSTSRRWGWVESKNG